MGFSRELLESSAAEAMTRALMVESLGLAMDSLMLDTTAATATRPAGLRNGVDVTAAAGASVDAMKTDLSTLAATVSGASGLDIAFVCDPKTASESLADLSEANSNGRCSPQELWPRAL